MSTTFNFGSTLSAKYKELVDAAHSEGVTNLQVREQNNVLYIDGDAPNGDTKKKLWDIYNKIDPDYRSGDVIMNIDVTADAGGQAKVTTDSSNLNIRKAPGTDAEIVGKAAHGEIVTVISTPNDQWSYVKTSDGIIGYAYNQYLTKV